MHIDDEFVAAEPSEIGTDKAFAIFEIDSQIRDRIAASISKDGYDPSKPIVVWRDRNAVIDGHTRRLAAIDARKQVLVCFADFEDEDEAIDYAVRCQKDRRNLTTEGLFAAIKAVDTLRIRGGDRRSEQAKSKAPAGAFDSPPQGHHKSAYETAAIVGIAHRTVERVRTITDYAEKTGDTSEMEAVVKGEKTITGAYMTTVAKKRRDREVSGKASKKNVQQACRSVSIVNGQARSLDVRLMERPVEPIDEAWLGSLPARAFVVRRDNFDADALIVRRCKPLLQAIRDEIERAIGPRSPSGMTPLHRAIHRVLGLANPESWRVCDACKGGAHGKGPACRECDGNGYVIPNFTKGSN